MIAPFLLCTFLYIMTGINLLSEIHSVHVGGDTITATQTVWIRSILFQTLSQVAQDDPRHMSTRLHVSGPCVAPSFHTTNANTYA
jgi:hypothetical protein